MRSLYMNLLLIHMRKASSLPIFLLKARKLRLREVKYLAQGHMPCKRHGQNQNMLFPTAPSFLRARQEQVIFHAQTTLASAVLSSFPSFLKVFLQLAVSSQQWELQGIMFLRQHCWRKPTGFKSRYETSWAHAICSNLPLVLAGWSFGKNLCSEII